MSFRDDRSWASGLCADVEGIITAHLDQIVSVRIASDEEDVRQATDMVVEVSGGTIAVRVRDTVRDFRDWTVRSRRRSGVRTEMEKIRAGYARWYLYGWCRGRGRVGDYVLIDLDKVRGAGLLDVARRQWSADGGQTFFVAVPVTELRAAGCLAVDACAAPCPRPRRDYSPRTSTKGGGS